MWAKCFPGITTRTPFTWCACNANTRKRLRTDAALRPHTESKVLELAFGKLGGGVWHPSVWVECLGIWIQVLVLVHSPDSTHVVRLRSPQWLPRGALNAYQKLRKTTVFAGIRRPHSVLSSFASRTVNGATGKRRSASTKTEVV